MNWKEEIIKLVMIKQALAELDRRHVWPHHLPSVAASADALSQVEARLGYALDKQHAEFLSHADGWKGFYQTVDLFGVADLSGSSKMLHALSLLEVMADSLTASGLKVQDLLPIGVTTLDRDLFVITKPGTPKPGTVIWLAGEEVGRFESFEDFFLAMVDYNREEVASFRNPQS